MIPPRDRVGQIRMFARTLEQRLGASVRGLWLPERVWEQTLTGDLAEAGVDYLVLDDFHFKNAGLTDDDLAGWYLTEDDGRIVSIFPGSERMRYLIPFGPPQETIEHLRGVAERHHDAVVVFGDDGEKFGTWPETKQHVYDDGWLRQFFDALAENRDWIDVCTLAEAADGAGPRGKIYIPDGSYREMTEWSLPAERQTDYDSMVHDMQNDPRWERVRPFVRGGFWRNFRVKYPEANEMYSRMVQVSRRLAECESSGADAKLLAAARRELYRGQCNCSYWHGAFGGIYLPHLRNAVYNHLIAADNLLDQAEGTTGPGVSASAEDYNFDARPEVKLAGDRLIALLAPADGGQLYELDVRSICHNLLASIARRPEAYHQKVLAGASGAGGDVASIHDRVVFKQEGLDQRLFYDDRLRKSLIDRFYDHEICLDRLYRSEAEDRGDFAGGRYETRIRRSPDRVQAVLTREGVACGHTVKITKGITLETGSAVLQVAYRLEGLPAGEPLHFGVELNFAGLPSGADDRYFYHGDSERLGQLGERLDRFDESELHLVDEWLGIDVGVSFNRPTHLWTFPIETVSQSEGGFELVHQSVVVHPHWFVEPDADGRWGVTFDIHCDTSLAESRMQQEPAGELLEPAIG